MKFDILVSFNLDLWVARRAARIVRGRGNSRILLEGNASGLGSVGFRRAGSDGKRGDLATISIQISKVHLRTRNEQDIVDITRATYQKLKKSRTSFSVVVGAMPET